MSRRAQIYVNPSDLIRLLDLPPGTAVRAVQSRFDPPGVLVCVEHPGLPDVDDEVEAPLLHPSVSVTEKGRRHHWSFGDPL